MLGLNGLVVKSHGGANATGIAAAIRIAVELARSDYLEKVAVKLKRFEKAVPPTAPAASETQ